MLHTFNNVTTNYSGLSISFTVLPNYNNRSIINFSVSAITSIKLLKRKAKRWWRKPRILESTIKVMPKRFWCACTKSSSTQRTENKTTDVVFHQHSRKLLKMDILMSETCSAHNKWNKIASDIKLVFQSSTIAIMHGPINIKPSPCIEKCLETWATIHWCKNAL